MTNTSRVNRISLSELLTIRTPVDFSDFLINKAIQKYCSDYSDGLGDLLAICATEREAKNFRNYQFDSVTLSGLHDQADALRPLLESDSRLRYERQNGEALSYDDKSFDLVFCKSGLHHFSRPVLGLYEMLRVARRGVVFIEPYETFISKVFDSFGLRSVYERDERMNIDARDNYVFRWNKRLLEQLLNSYYLESGYELDISIAWMSNKINANKNALVRLFGTFGGTVFSFLPGCGGNQILCFIKPGTQLPPPPISIQELLD